ncbi:hypothetical protein AVANS14531_07700 [Campylobacter sp. Cr9]|uniref:hypothetical protein n=1 Tax=Campylobacter sp. Cr9 TaxID=2735728 RepID=UPI003014C170|nr:hypothetical protein [Campylobacter sp. Cr9]
MKKTLEILKILFMIFVIIEIVIAFYSVFAGVIFSIGSNVNVIYSIILCFFAANYFIYENLSQIIILFYKGFILYPLIYLQAFIIIFFIILFFKLRKKFNNKLAFTYSVIPMIIIFALYNYFFRTIPDYSSKTNERIVTLSDYKKYQQGYCLEENRILPKDELYKRVVVDDLTKQLVYRDKVYKNLYNIIASHKYKIHKDINLDNYKDYLRKNAYSKYLVNYDELESVDYTKYLVIDTKNNTAIFTKPIILVSDGLISVTFYLDLAFEFEDNAYRFYKFYLSDEFDERKDKEKEYKRRLEDVDYWLLSYENDIKEQRISYNYKFDNCGYSNFDPEKEEIE